MLRLWSYKRQVAVQIQKGLSVSCHDWVIFRLLTKALSPNFALKCVAFKLGIRETMGLNFG